MIESGKTYVVMGLLDSDSIAYAIGETVREMGGNVIYTVQNERMKRIFIDRSKKLTDEQKAALQIEYCDVTVDDEVARLFTKLGEVAGVVHSIGFANPKTCLGEEFHTDAIDDIKQALEISSISLATVVRHAEKAMPSGGSIVTLTFDTRNIYPGYNWMGVCKAALEAIMRGLARRHGHQHIRINALSAGPLATKAATSIPGFSDLSSTWDRMSPIPWDTSSSKQDVANVAAFLLGPYSRVITGETIHADGGATIIAGNLLDHEK
ncbi:MAG: SDR family oxidoreductase [Verrucomicrobia bacterium]|nr:SDR family oxidoreductase [Verrucomicrobiota bacterium]MDA1087029.1 SDR family oxidoreductase [Verrucomicrobiota bacterium]